MIRFVNPGGRPRRPVEPKPSVQEPTPEPLDRKVQMKAEMKRQAGDIRERIPEAEVFESEEDIRVLFSTLMMFKKNSFELSESHRRELAGFQKVFLEYPGTRLIIEGYTDDTGNEPLNLDLSRKRAEAVMSELLRLGIPAERMRASGLGQERPRYPNDSESNRRRNRRVELVIVRD
jgi:outer membrane protein OmpA-like peptidoglycan-associated protein